PAIRPAGLGSSPSSSSSRASITRCQRSRSSRSQLKHARRQMGRWDGIAAPPGRWEYGASGYRYSFRAGIRLRRDLFPGAKELKETSAIAHREAVFAERSHSGDGPAHLLKIGAAPFTHGQMSLEARALSGGKHVF